MGLISVARPLLLVFLLFLAGTAWAQNDDDDDSSSQAKNITCYGVGGKSYGDNYKCPGSNACCGSVDLCLPNRLCKSVGMSDDIFIRGPCSINPYDEEECAQICLYSGFLPGFLGRGAESEANLLSSCRRKHRQRSLSSSHNLQRR